MVLIIMAIIVQAEKCIAKLVIFVLLFFGSVVNIFSKVIYELTLTHLFRS